MQGGEFYYLAISSLSALDLSRLVCDANYCAFSLFSTIPQLEIISIKPKKPYPIACTDTQKRVMDD